MMRAHTSSRYGVIAEQVPVAAARATGPSFSNTLSTGDRRTLALTFFFAALDRTP